MAASLGGATFAALDDLTLPLSPNTIGLTAICKHIERHCQDADGVQVFRSVCIGGDCLSDGNAPAKEEVPLARLWCNDWTYRPSPAQFFLREQESQCELVLYYYSFAKTDLHRRQIDIGRAVLSLLEQPGSGITGSTGIMPGSAWNESTQSFTDPALGEFLQWWFTRGQAPRIEHGNDYRTLSGVHQLSKYWYATKISFGMTALHHHTVA